MAEGDLDGQFYDEDDDDLDFFYVEDTYPLADELAETSVPDPGYAGTAWELDESWYDYDLYEYWDDLEYGIDTYWDSAGSDASGKKRKRPEGAIPPAPGKRTKLDLKQTGGETALYISMAERRRLWNKRAPVKKGLTKFALLPDWRQQCAQADNTMSVKAMPVEMKKAAEGQEDDTPEHDRHYDAEMVLDEGEDEGWDDEEELDGAEDDAEHIQSQLANLDTDTLKSILRQKLGDAGLQGMDEGAFMQTIERMLSGDGGAGDAAGDLANSLLGQATQGNDSALSGWLSQQGVSLDGAEEDDDAESVATAELPENCHPRPKAKAMQVSPPDSAIEVVKKGRTSELAMHDGSPKLAKKRMAPAVDEGGESAVRKRKKVAFDVPASQEAEATVMAGNEDDTAQAASSEDPLAASGPATSELQITTSDDPLASESTVRPQPTRASRSEASFPDAAALKTPAPSKSKQAHPKTKGGSVGPAKSTRKRKAQGDEEEEPPPQPPKKQTRRAAAKRDAGDEQTPGYARATRATRARGAK